MRRVLLLLTLLAAVTVSVTAVAHPTAAARIGPCRDADVRLAVSLGQPLTGALLPFVRMTLAPRRAPCLLSSTVRLTIQRRTASGWRTAPVTDDPSSRRLKARLRPGEPVIVLWAWRNWCGGAGPFRARASGAGHTVTAAPRTHPSRCDDAGAPSTLAPSYG